MADQAPQLLQDLRLSGRGLLRVDPSIAQCLTQLFAQRRENDSPGKHLFVEQIGAMALITMSQVAQRNRAMLVLERILEHQFKLRPDKQPEVKVRAAYLPVGKQGHKPQMSMHVAQIAQHRPQ